MTRRSVGTAALLALGINGIVGVGIFFAPSELATLAGPKGSVAVIVGVGVAMLPVAATFAILGRRFAEDGGPVTFARAAFGERLAFAIGWLSYVGAVFSTSAVLSGLAHAVVSPSIATPCSIGFAVLLAGLAAAGIDVSKRAWSALTVLKLLPLVGLAALAVWKAPRGLPIETAAISPSSWGRAALAACFVYQGFEVVPVVAGETRAPDRAVPIAILGSLAFSTLLYAVLQWTFVTTAAGYAQEAPLAHVAERLGGYGFGRVVRVGTSVSALGIAFGMIVTTPRYLSAAATRSRLARVNARAVPVEALALTTALLVVLLMSTTLSALFTLSSISVVVQYAVVACALVKLAMTRKLGLRPLHAVPAFATLVVAAVLLAVPGVGGGVEEFVSLAILAALGIVVHRMIGATKP